VATARQPPKHHPGTSLSQPFVPWSALDEAVLDAPVRPLVAALNRTGWARTVFSCGGHPEEPDSVAQGRRQAHVDVVVADLGAWHRFVERCRHEAPAAVQRQAPAGVRLRVAEGSLGPLPAWLRAALAAEAGAERPPPEPYPPGQMHAEHAPRLPVAAPWWWDRAALLLARRLARLLRRHSSSRDGPPERRWRFRRLVFEPVPYDAEPAACRRALDAALAAAVASLAAC
jgi:hypothetical protein